MNLHEQKYEGMSVTYTDQIRNFFRQGVPYTFFSINAIAAHVDSIPAQYADQIIIGTIQYLRRWHNLGEKEAIISVRGSGGYMWTPDSTIVGTIRPSGYRPSVFYDLSDSLQRQMTVLWDEMRTVTIKDDTCAIPLVKESLYFDVSYFAQNMGQNISVKQYAQELDCTEAEAFSRIRKMARFLDTIPESRLAVISSYGYAEYRLDLV